MKGERTYSAGTTAMSGRTINLSYKERELSMLETCPAQKTWSLFHQGIIHIVPATSFSHSNS